MNLFLHTRFLSKGNELVIVNLVALKFYFKWMVN